jgi:hypothetical protein
MIQQSHSWGYTQRNATHVKTKSLFTACLLQHYLQQLSYGNSQDALQLMNGLRKCDIYAQWNFTQPQRRMEFHSFTMEFHSFTVNG